MKKYLAILVILCSMALYSNEFLATESLKEAFISYGSKSFEHAILYNEYNESVGNPNRNYIIDFYPALARASCSCWYGKE